METFIFGLKYWKRNIPLSIVSQFLSFISIIADLMFPMLTGILLNYIIKGIPMEEGAGGIFSFLLTGAYGQVQTFELFYNVAITYIVFILVRIILIYCKNILNQKLGLNLETDLRYATFHKLMELDSQTVSEYNSGELLQILGGDTTMFKEMFCRIVPGVFDSIFMMCVSIYLLSTMNIWFILIPLALMAVVGLIYGLSTGMLQSNVTTVVPVEGVSGNPLFASVCATAFAYEGWIIATSINAELKDSKKNLPKALIIGGVIIAAIYIFYYMGVAGGASVETLMSAGAPVAFTNVFGKLGVILTLFVAISCLGTLNGLMIGCTRGMYALAARNKGPKPQLFGQLDPQSNMAPNSAVAGLLVCAAWGLYFYVTQLFGTFGNFAIMKDVMVGNASLAHVPFVFDSSEIPIITMYAMYLPIFFCWMKKEKGESVVNRFVLPILATLASCFVVFACVISHKMANLWYLVVFAVIMLVGALFARKKAA